MRTIFNKGQEVYDEVFFPNRKLTISNINYRKEVIEVCGKYYDFEGYRIEEETNERLSTIPTLSTKPYSLNGFEQKSKIPTYKMAEDWYEKRYYKKVELDDAARAMRKLSVLRDYYNNGWIPDLKKYFYIGSFFDGHLAVMKHEEVNYKKHFLFFETEKLAELFLNEQRELLEIAKPLL